MVILNYSSNKATEKTGLKMFVLKRDGRKEPVMFDKITSRIQKLCYGLNMDYIEPPFITMKVINGLYSGVTTVELDTLAAETAISFSNKHPDYATLAARIEVSNLHKETKKSFSEVVEEFYQWSNKRGANYPRIDNGFYEVVQKNADVLNSSIIYDRDFSFSFLSFKMLENDYLLRINGKVIERPQHMFMRIAVAIHGEDLDAVMETYNMLSEMQFIVNPLVMRFAGFASGQLLDTFCTTMKSDSIEGIYDCLSDCGQFGRVGGSVGLNIQCIRAMGSYIAGTNGTSNGLTPMLRVFNSLAKFTHLGGRNIVTPITIYVELWHADILDYLTLKKPTGKEEQRAKSLSYAVVIPDLFMKRTEDDGDWALMCPNDSKELQNLWGEDFEKIYTTFEREGRYVRVVKARQIWSSIVQSQIETGGPLMLYKDNINRKSNCSNIGPIISSSHSGELMVPNSSNEFFGCSSALISLHSFVKTDRTFDFPKLKECSKAIVRALNRIIDSSTSRVHENILSTHKRRPLSVGVQGLADALLLMRLPYASEEAKKWNRRVFETVYFGALESSCELAQKFGAYDGFEGSPVSRGILQFDMWNVSPSDLHDWTSLKGKISEHGIRNCVMVGFAASETCATLHNCNPGADALITNLNRFKMASGKYVKVINHHLLKDLTEGGLWDENVEGEILANDGSVQAISSVPGNLKELYKNSWEVSQREVLQMAADRAPFMDQSQALRICLSNANYGKVTSMHFFGWKLGLKTGMSNLETKLLGDQAGSSKSDQVEGASKMVQTNEDDARTSENLASMTCSLENKDDCLMCGS